MANDNFGFFRAKVGVIFFSTTEVGGVDVNTM